MATYCCCFQHYCLDYFNICRICDVKVIIICYFTIKCMNEILYNKNVWCGDLDYDATMVPGFNVPSSFLDDGFGFIAPGEESASLSSRSFDFELLD